MTKVPCIQASGKMLKSKDSVLDRIVKACLDNNSLVRPAASRILEICQKGAGELPASAGPGTYSTGQSSNDRSDLGLQAGRGIAGPAVNRLPSERGSNAGQATPRSSRRNIGSRFADHDLDDSGLVVMPKTVPVFAGSSNPKPRYVGIVNLGATGYLSSAVHLLNMLAPFHKVRLLFVSLSNRKITYSGRLSCNSPLHPSLPSLMPFKLFSRT